MTQDTTHSFRPCTPADVDLAVPLMLSSGVGIYRYLFSQLRAEQALDFLHYCFVKSRGQFSYKWHTAVLVGEKQVGIGAVSTQKQNLSFLLHAAFTILAFFGLWRGLVVMIRGLRVETILKPPKARVGLIYNVAVSEESRGLGLGRALMMELLRQVKELQLPRAALDVLIGNTPAKTLYESVGFVTIEKNVANLEAEFGSVRSHERMEKAQT